MLPIECELITCLIEHGFTRDYYARRFGADRPIAPYLSPVDSTFYIRIVLFVPLIFLDSAIFSLFKFILF